jgi:magnesium-protoporphyrin O-methyltransferase
MTCCQRRATADQFDAATAARDLRRFRRRGPDKPTRRLIAAVEARPLPRRPTLLDIGGGVGAIHHALLDHGFSQATHLDASGAYLTAAADEARRQGHAGRVEFLLATFPAEASTLSPADVVTLDRVVCCDPDYEGLLGAAANHARHLLAFSYPRARWVTRLVVAGANTLRRLSGRAFRAYVHPPARMNAVLERSGMRQVSAGGTWIWAVEAYERVGALDARRP